MGDGKVGEKVDVLAEQMALSLVESMVGSKDLMLVYGRADMMVD